MARPVIAKRQAEIALSSAPMASPTVCTGKGNDQVRFELAYKAIAPNIQIIAPWREWDIDSREDAIAYAQKYNVPVEQSKKISTAATATSGTSARRRRTRRSRQRSERSDVACGSFHLKKLRTKPKKSKSDSNPARLSL